MRLLVDTNVFLELLLEQARSAEARQVLEQIEANEFFVSDYALHSIGMLLFRRKQPRCFAGFSPT